MKFLITKNAFVFANLILAQKTSTGIRMLAIANAHQPEIVELIVSGTTSIADVNALSLQLVKLVTVQTINTGTTNVVNASADHLIQLILLVQIMLTNTGTLVFAIGCVFTKNVRLDITLMLLLIDANASAYLMNALRTNTGTFQNANVNVLLKPALLNRSGMFQPAHASACIKRIVLQETTGTVNYANVCAYQMMLAKLMLQTQELLIGIMTHVRAYANTQMLLKLLHTLDNGSIVSYVTGFSFQSIVHQVNTGLET